MRLPLVALVRPGEAPGLAWWAAVWRSPQVPALVVQELAYGRGVPLGVVRILAPLDLAQTAFFPVLDRAVDGVY
jgi:hypothetical protein